MGTPEFACPTLKKLLAQQNNDPKFEIVAVYSREPQIGGRGHKLQNSPIHNLALQNGLKIITPKTLRDAAVQKEFSSFNADAAVVVAYGLILPQEILDGTKLGCFNIHPSLLPRWRGAAPIQRTIMSGDKETAVCVIKMDKGLDSGEIVAKLDYKLSGKETYAELEKEFSEIGAELLVKSLKGNLHGIKQDEVGLTYAKKLEKSECEIDWKKSAEEIDCHIRGLSGSLGAYFVFKEEKIKIFSAEILNKNSCENAVGEISKSDFSIQCGCGVIKPLTLQRQGKKAMPLEEFLRGIKI
jgi:methionyl-tRNA formyltransferase